MYREESSLQGDLKEIARVMNLKSFNFRSREDAPLMRLSSGSKKKKDEFKDINIHLSMFNEIHII